MAWAGVGAAQRACINGALQHAPVFCRPAEQSLWLVAADRLIPRHAAASQLVDVGNLDHRRQHRDAKQRQETNAGTTPRTACL